MRPPAPQRLHHLAPDPSSADHQMTRGRRWFLLWCYIKRARGDVSMDDAFRAQSCSVAPDSVKVCKYRSAMFPFGCFSFCFFYDKESRVTAAKQRVSIVPPSPSLVHHASDSAAVALTERIQNKSVQVLRLQGQRIVNKTERKWLVRLVHCGNWLDGLRSAAVLQEPQQSHGVKD